MARILRRCLLITALLAMMLSLAGCTLVFTLQGSSSYAVLPSGVVKDGALVECEMEMDISTSGFILRLPAKLNVELEGLIMSMSMEASEIDTALDSIGGYLETQLGFEDHTWNATSDTFLVTGQFDLIDFWSSLGISKVGASLGPIAVPLRLIIGQTAYENLIDSIAYVASSMIEPATSIDFQLEGTLKALTDQMVGTFILWFDTINPIS